MLRVVLCVAATWGGLAAAAAQELSFEDRFRLWNGCKPMRLVIEHLRAEAIDIGLTRKSLTTVVESRLRAARLYYSGANPYLYVQTHFLFGLRHLIEVDSHSHVLSSR